MGAVHCGSEVETARIRVLVASGLALVLEAICQSLQVYQDIEIVGKAADRDASLEQVRALRPDVVVIDGSMRTPDGVQAARLLAREPSESKIIILAQNATPELLLEALAAGAHGCLPMATSAAELASAVRTVYLGTMFLHPSLTRCLVEDYVRLTKAGYGDPYERLTAKEKHILQLVAEGRSGPQVARELGIAVRTAEGHIARIMSKLDIHGRGRLIRYAMERGVVPLER